MGELAVLEEGLADPDTRLLTVTGPGGSGKTRLALEAVKQLAQQDRHAHAEGSPLAFPHGILFVPLAAVDSVEGLVQALANALQLRLDRGLDQLLDVLSRRQPYQNFSHERIAYKYLTWSWQLSNKDRDGLTRQQFTRYYLMRLGIGHDLERIALNPKYPRRIASEAEVLALRPELNQTE